ncbi:RNA polymerase factor sigma-54 [Saccharicrinis sp. FJH62]|uniref:RNA polymerase factor sigma-54 n=1 Tax=Saccharicrinis sp. FJH62 TaxID=3344657 RepID=UPI0035D49343
MQKLTLQQKLQQKLSPLQIQVIKLLEVPAMELEQRIKKELEENPVLEEGKDEDLSVKEEDPYEESGVDDDFSLDEYINQDDIPAYKLRSRNYSKDDKKTEIPFSVGKSFHEFLLNQLGEIDLSEEDHQLAEYVIGNIDEDGYIRRDVEAMSDDLAFIMNLDVQDAHLLKILKRIQKFDPPGVAARDLRECLILQIRRKDRSRDVILRAEEIVDEHFDAFTKKHYEKILKKTGWTQEQFKEALDEIQKLNPKPGSSYSNQQVKSVQQIVPDFILDLKDDELVLSLNNRNVPDLKVSQTYADMLETYASSKGKQSREQKDAVLFVKQKLDSAKWFIEAIKQRHNTLMTTMQAIVDMQHEYFADGDETRLKPMHLKDIAAVTGYDISTISRVSNSKYIQTHFGIFPVKYFFSDAMQTDSGEEVSTKEIKTILSEAIEAENKRRPLTDDKLAQLLNDKGYHIARRTVAKYREQLGVPVARLRKEL